MSYVERARNAYRILVEKLAGDVLVFALSSDFARRTILLLYFKKLED
jgi:hypothetical protein